MVDKTIEVRQKLLTKPVKDVEFSRKSRDYLSTGSTQLNLACSNRTNGGVPKGAILHLVGDSDSGKTVVGMGMFAEASRSKAFDDHELLFFNAEDGALMDWVKFFGKKAVSRIRELKPRTLEEFYYLLDDYVQKKQPFVALLDSMDTLPPKAWLKKFAAAKGAARKEVEESGDFGTQKAKVNSENLRNLKLIMPRLGSILTIISQTRDNLGARFGDKKSVSGGKVLKFFAALQVWMVSIKTIQKTVRKKPRNVGILSIANVKKNHVTGNKRSILVSILNEIGVDDVGDCIDYLVDEGHWKRKKGKPPGIAAPEMFDSPLSRSKLIRAIEHDDMEDELRKLVKAVWTEIEEGCVTGRKKRYE